MTLFQSAHGQVVAYEYLSSETDIKIDSGSTDLSGTYCEGSCDIRGLAPVTLGDFPL